jgi:hypothetical protein
VATRGDQWRRRRGLVGGLVGPPVGWRRWRTGRRRCRGPGRTGRGDVGDWSAATSGDWSEDWSVHPCGDVGGLSAAMSTLGGLVGGDVSGTGRRRRRGDWSEDGRSTRGDAGDWSAAMSGTGRRDWSVAGGLVGGDVGGLVETGRSTRGCNAGGLVAAMSGTGRRTGRWRCRGLVGGDVGTGRRTGRSTRGWRRWRTGRRRCRGLVGGLVGGDVGDWSAATSGTVGGSVGPPVRRRWRTGRRRCRGDRQEWSVAMSGTGRRRRRGPVGGWSVHPWVATLADYAAMSVGLSRPGRWRCRGTGRRRRGTVGGLVGPPAGWRRWRTGRRRCRPVGGTGRWRCRGLVGGDVGLAGGSPVHPRVATLADCRRRSNRDR